MQFVENMPGHLLRRFHQASVGIFHQEMDAMGFDLTPVQFAALDRVQRSPGVDQITLASLIACDRTTMAGVINRLVQKSWIQRSTNLQDRRSKSLYLSSHGETVLDRVRPAVNNAQQLMLSGLSEAERIIFMRLLEQAMLSVSELSRTPQKVTPEVSENQTSRY